MRASFSALNPSFSAKNRKRERKKFCPLDCFFAARCRCLSTLQSGKLRPWRIGRCELSSPLSVPLWLTFDVIRQPMKGFSRLSPTKAAMVS
jgi:hypothetical protein